VSKNDSKNENNFKKLNTKYLNDNDEKVKFGVKKYSEYIIAEAANSKCKSVRQMLLGEDNKIYLGHTEGIFAFCLFIFSIVPENGKIKNMRLNVAREIFKRNLKTFDYGGTFESNLIYLKTKNNTIVSHNQIENFQDIFLDEYQPKKCNCGHCKGKKPYFYEFMTKNIKILPDENEYKTLDDIRKELPIHFNVLITEEPNPHRKYNYIHAPGGVGKTYTICENISKALNQYNRVFIAFKYHKLINDAELIMKEKNPELKIIKTKKLDIDSLQDETLKEKLKRMMDIKISDISIYDYIYEHYSKHLNIKNETHDEKIMTEFLRQNDDLKNVKNAVILTTHDKVIKNNDLINKNDLLIFDEQPNVDKRTKVSRKQFENLAKELYEKGNCKRLWEHIQEILNSDQKSRLGKLKFDKKQQSVLLGAKNFISGIGWFFDTNTFYKQSDGNQMFELLKHEKLPTAAKTIVLSQEAPSPLLLEDYNFKVNEFKCKKTENTKIFHVHTKLGSKSKQEDLNEIINEVKNHFDKDFETVTYKNLNHGDIYFGFEEGHNDLIGKNLIIAGVPRLSVEAFELSFEIRKRKANRYMSTSSYKSKTAICDKFCYFRTDEKTFTKTKKSGEDIVFEFSKNKIQQALTRARILENEVFIVTIGDVIPEQVDYICEWDEKKNLKDYWKVEN